MAIIKDPAHMENLFSNMTEVDRLLEIHARVTKPGRGRKHAAVQVLHKSGIVLLVACWEAFVEDLAASALRLMIDKGDRHTIFPSEVLDRVASKYQGKNAWKLAGTGWKSAMNNHFREVLARTTGTLNTPKTEQVDELFSKVLGIPKLSSQWVWRGRTGSRSATEELDKLVTLRGSIAHRVQSSETVRKSTVSDARGLVGRLAVKSHNAINAYLESKIGGTPWDRYRFEGTL